MQMGDQPDIQKDLETDTWKFDSVKTFHIQWPLEWPFPALQVTLSWVFVNSDVHTISSSAAVVYKMDRIKLGTWGNNTHDEVTLHTFWKLVMKQKYVII